MTKLLVLVSTTIFSAVGWSLGARIGPMTGFILSMVGFGVGMWYGRRWGARLGG